MSSQKRYYEQEAFWKFDYWTIPAERERIEQTINLIPPDVRSILDAGCGNGNLVNILADGKLRKFDRIVGLDWSEEALKHVKSEKRQGVITDIPFEDGSFDLVTALEVLEHLPVNEFAKSLTELQRVSRRYIMITVPNREDLERSLIECVECHCRFNPHFHVRSFDEQKMRSLFSAFECLHLSEIGPLISYTALGKVGLSVLRSIRPAKVPATAICPQCGHESSSERKAAGKSAVSESAEGPVQRKQGSGLLRSVFPKVSRKRWLHALYRKRTAG